MMKRLVWLLILAVSPVVVAAQTAGDVKTLPPGLTISTPEWREVPVSAGPTFDLFQESRPVVNARTRFDPTYRNSLPPSFRGPVAVNASSPTSLNKGRMFAPFREAFVEVTNMGAQAIKAIRLEFVFTGPTMGTEVLRLKLLSKKKLLPGASKVLKKTVRGSTRHRRGDDAVLSVEIGEILYADGTVWRRS